MRKIILNVLRSIEGRLPSSQGNILVYIVMTMVIFGVLGVTMVSLFSTSISSTATQNDTRRATYLSEAGTRYAMGEMLSADFSRTTINNLNATEYTLNQAGRFRINVFSPWFEPESNIDLGSNFSDQTRTYDVIEGNVPNGFINQLPTSASGLALVNYDYINIGGALNPPPSARAIVTGGAEVVGDPLKLQLRLDDDTEGFVANRNETVSFAVQPFSDASIPGNLFLQPAALRVFPGRNGSIEIRKRNFYYDQALDRTTHVELTDVRPVEDESGSPLTVSASDDYVILNPRNRYVISEGHSGDVYFGNHMNFASAISDISTLSFESLKPDIEFDEEADLPGVLSQVEQNINVVNVFNDPGNKYISLSASGGSFGAVWFRDTRSIGGIRNFCDTGGCFFNIGFRAFFIISNYTGTDGDGFTFSILNRSNNDIGSVGGDINLSELMGYAGDSRTISCPSLQSGFLDGEGVGLQPPKIALEFDGKANNQNPTICNDNTCIDSSSVNQGSRFDPGFSGVDRDAVQYVFWGSNNDLINAPCRINTFLTPNTNKTYDDNRHDTVTEIWAYPSGSRSLSSPAIDDSDPLNIRIYTGRSSENISGSSFDRGRIIRHRPSDGTANAPGWTRNPDTTPGNDDDIDSSPALDVSSWANFRPIERPYDNGIPNYSGDIFIGNDAFYLSKYNSSGTLIWSTRLENDDNIEGKPAVSSDAKNRVYVVGDTGTLYSINKSTGARRWAFDIFIGTTSEDFTSSPIVIEGSGANPNIIYVGSLDNALYAVRDNDGTAAQVFRYTRPTGPIRSTPAINPVSGDIYFGSDDNRVYAVSNAGADRWVFVTGGDVVSSPAVTSDGTRLYVGSDDNYLYALNAQNGNQIWRYQTNDDVRSSPTIAADGAIYFGSDDGHLYAVNPDGTLRWQYPPPGASALDRIRCKPAVGPDGIIYFTTDDATEGRLYALDPAFNDPPNDPGIYLTPAQLEPTEPYPGLYGNNWLTEGPWAVRLEVQRSITPNGLGNYEYTLKTWLKKCQDADCTNLVGTSFFQNTRFEYDWATAGITPMTQTIELSNTPDSFHDRFDRFLFGFTSASTASQTIEIRKFQLSFIRPNDPVVND